MVLAGVASSISASAQTIRQRQDLAQDRQQVAEHIADANKTCGTNVTLSVDWNSFAGAKTAPENTNAQSAWSFIVNATDALDAVCREGADSKAAISSNLHTITVSHASSEQMDYRGGVLHYGVPYQGAGYSTLERYMLDHIGSGGGVSRNGNTGSGTDQGKAVNSAIDGLKRRLNLPN